MELPNWFKVLWWLLLVLLFSFFLYQRYPELAAGKGTNADMVVLVTWITLLLAPLFKEVSIFGITLKQEIMKLRELFMTQVSQIRSDVRNAVDVQTSFSPQIVMPPTDAQLPELETRIKSAVSDALVSRGSKEIEEPAADLSVSEEISLLFATRYNIEKELRRMWASQQPEPQSRQPPAVDIIAYWLVAMRDKELGQAIRQVISVCSAGIHGEPVTDAQVSFVKDVGPKLVAALRTMK